MSADDPEIFGALDLSRFAAPAEPKFVLRDVPRPKRGRHRGVDVLGLRGHVEALGGVSATARTLGVTRRTVQLWLARTSRPSAEMAERIVALGKGTG